MPRPRGLDAYSQRRLDRMAEDVAVTRHKVEAIERLLSARGQELREQEGRLDRLERRLFALWVLGPILVGGAMVLQSLKSWFSEP